MSSQLDLVPQRVFMSDTFNTWLSDNYQNWRVRCYNSTPSSFLSSFGGNQSVKFMNEFFTKYVQISHCILYGIFDRFDVSEVVKLMPRAMWCSSGSWIFSFSNCARLACI